jgi:hypothetical protein
MAVQFNTRIETILSTVGDMNKNKYKLRSIGFDHKRLSQVYTPFHKNKTCRVYALTSPPF